MFLWCSQCLSCLWRSGFPRCLLWTSYINILRSVFSRFLHLVCNLWDISSREWHSRGGRMCLRLWSKGMVFDLPITPLELGEAAFRVFWNWVGEESTDRAQLLCFFWRSSPALGVSYLSLRTAWFLYFNKTWQKGSYNSFCMLQISGEYQNFQLFF